MDRWTRDREALTVGAVAIDDAPCMDDRVRQRVRCICANDRAWLDDGGNGDCTEPHGDGHVALAHC